MSDRDFLMWIHERLEHVHGEKPIVDYMHKLRCIIHSMDADTVTHNDGRGCNGLEELKARLSSEVAV